MNFTNNLTLTDDELSVVMTSLQLTIMGYEKYVDENGKASVDIQTRDAYEDTKKLYTKLKNEFF